MEHLSIHIDKWREQLRAIRPDAKHAIVIGSGYGGSVAALRLAQLLQSKLVQHVTVLERGAEFEPGDFPNDSSQVPKHLRWPSPDGTNVSGRAHGLFEWRAGPGVLSLVANGVGGGSLINAGVLHRPDADVFEQAAWPASIRLGPRPEPAGVHKRLALEECFALAKTGLRGFDWTEKNFRKTDGFRQLVDCMPSRVGVQGTDVKRTFLTIDPDKCAHCGDCSSGCNVPNAKQTLRNTYLGHAHAAKAIIVHSASVWTISPQRSIPEPNDPHAPTNRWKLRVMDTAAAARWPRLDDAAEAEGFDVVADIVVLAAGTFGTTELLQRSRDRSGSTWWTSPALGERFSANGDSVSFVVGVPEAVNAIGVGADAYLEKQGERGNVGPTITSELTLRYKTRTQGSFDAATQSSGTPLYHRLCVQDGAVPGALARGYSELLSFGTLMSRLSHWTDTPSVGAANVDALGAGHERRGARGEAANAQAISQRSHVVLTMGHDGSEGRIVWVPKRDSSVPFWQSPEKLETYRIREELLTETADKMQAEWVPDLPWRPVPDSLSRVMSGPAPSPMLTTVHPLGGCAMGDDPFHSVVDDVGRLWRSDRRDDARLEDYWARHDNLVVVDGSVVPTALGVNPLWTITALAERSVHALVQRLAHEQRPVPLAAAQRKFLPSGTKPLTRGLGYEPDPWRATMRERLVCEKLPVKGSLARALGADQVGAELKLSLSAGDWLSLWDDADHLLTDITGTLRFQVAAADNKPGVASYRVLPGGRCQLLVPATRAELQRMPVSLVANFGPWLRAALTYLILRNDIFLPSNEPNKRETWLQRAERFLLGIKQIVHLTDKRVMDYRLRFTLEPQASLRDLEVQCVPEWQARLRDPAALPQVLELAGSKRVEYAATWREFGAWLVAWFKRLLPGPHAKPAPRLRESFAEQASHLTVTLTDDHGAASRGRFLMDFSAWLRKPAILLDTGDLSGGLLAMGAYPAFIFRYLIKTRLPDFRLPRYGRAPESRLMDEGRQLKVDGKALEVDGAPVREIRTLYSLSVPRGESSSDAGDANHDAAVELVLCRYSRPKSEGGLPAVTRGSWREQPVDRVKTVLLLHAFGQSGYTFTADTLTTNLAGKLYAADYEVWVLEYRLSTRIPCHRDPCNLDQIARYDLPIAVDHIRSVLSAEFLEKRGQQLVQPQIHAFAQCLGGASLAMSLLSGRLHYSPVLGSDGQPDAPCPKLASAIISQAHPICIGQPGSQARSWLPAFLRDALHWMTVPFSADKTTLGGSMIAAWMDRVLSALPIDDDERCPDSHGGDEDDAVTCRRVRFLEAPLFKHRNLDPDTHRQLPHHFGHGNIQTFAHAAKCVETERLVDEDGRPIYVNDANLDKFANLPICFLHGKDNELFHWHSARASAGLFARVQPGWAKLACAALGERVEERDMPYWCVEDHGHLDVLIGKDTPTRVYPGIVEFFNRIQSSEAVVADSQVELKHATARGPRCGPFLKPPRLSPDGKIRVRISFMIDDRFAEGKQGSRGVYGDRTWAFARVRAGSRLDTVRLRIASRAPSAKNLASDNPFEPNDGFPAYRFAVGDLVLTNELLAELRDAAAATHSATSKFPQVITQDLRVEAFSVHESLSTKRELDMLPLQDAFLHRPNEPEVALWLTNLTDLADQRRKALAADRVPLQDRVSRLRADVEGESRWAVVPAASMQACLSAAPKIFAHAQINLLAASCRYPGFPFDRQRVDNSVRAMLVDIAHRPASEKPAVALLLGDQIYADATAGIVDPLSPTERFVERHIAALRRASDGEDWTLGDLLARIPAVMVPDDHEYIDGYPSGSPLLRARPQRVNDVQKVVTRAAKDAWRYFQAPDGGAVRTFNAGPIRVLALDSRTHREQDRIFTQRQRDRIKAWIADPASRKHLNVIATGSVVMPGLRPEVDPTSPGKLDSFQWSESDRTWLMGELATACLAAPNAFRFVLLSGDYHVFHASQVLLDDTPVGIAIVAPPLYAPMPYSNARVTDLYLDEVLDAKTASGRTVKWRLADELALTRACSAMAELAIERITPEQGLYRVRASVEVSLIDYGERRPVQHFKSPDHAGNPAAAPKGLLKRIRAFGKSARYEHAHHAIDVDYPLLDEDLASITFEI